MRSTHQPISRTALPSGPTPEGGSTIWACTTKCCHCGRIKTTDGIWRKQAVDEDQAFANTVSHGICMPCAEIELDRIQHFLATGEEP